MNGVSLDRKLVTIMVCDYVGSTAAMELDEEESILKIDNCLNQIEEVVGEHGGRVFNHVGDALLAEFPSAVNAIKSAIASRSSLAGLADTSSSNMRFGLHMADVVQIGDDLRGDGVNLASRIQSASEPGEIDVSETLVAHIARNSPCRFDDLGEFAFKGISDPIRVYRVREQADRHRFQVEPTRVKPVKKSIRPNSLAVLPFKTATSADEDQAFLAEGLTDDLTLELSRLSNLFVSSRSATSSLISNDPVEIGRTLGVKYVLSGSVRKSGNRFRMNVSLSNTNDGEIIWSDKIQRSFDDIFDILDELSMRISSTVSGRIEHDAISAARLKRPENMTAYECYLRGLDLHRMGGVTDEHIHNAKKWFTKSIEEDPNFGRPYAMYVCSDSGLPTFDMGFAETYLRRALELDPSDPEAHRIMGVLLMKVYADYETSRIHHEKALKLAPNDAYVMGRCAAFFLYVGELDRAVELLDLAESLDPFLHVWVMEERIAILHYAQKYREMLLASEQLPFHTRRSRCYRASALLALGEEDRARGEIERSLAENPDFTTQYVIRNEPYQDRDVLKELLKRLHHLGLPASREE
ncbi:MAG: adenylate cyclase [Parasphingorhabdus sp.]|jgi:adenylate cyclase